MRKRILYKLNSFIIILVFSIAIFVPFFIGVIEKDKDISAIEKRKLSTFPKIGKNINDIKKFPKLFDAYYSDHFGLRDWFTEHYKLIKYSLGDSPSEDVTIGKDGWLFLGSIKKGYTKYRDPIGDFRGVNLYSKIDLEKLANYMTAIKFWLNKKGIEYIFVIAPNKHSIYYDKLPDYISKINEHSVTDQLVEYLKLYTNIPVVDLRAKLINSKGKYQLYSKTGTHWNHYAANIAQYAIMLEIEKLFPGQIQPEIINLKNGVKGGGYLSHLVGVRSFKEPNPQPIFEKTCTPKKKVHDKKGRPKYTWICEKQKLNAVIFRDSFFSALRPYFSRKFKRSTYIWENLNYPSLVKYIELEKPDVVIEEWVERHLPFVPQPIQEFSYSLNREIFNCSDELIFSNDFKKLRFNAHLKLKESINKSIKLKSIGKDPIITFPLIPFKREHQYIIHIKIQSSVDSFLQLSDSDHKASSYQFSEKNLPRTNIKSGNNDLYITVYHDNLGKHLKLEPISNIGEIEIKTIEIKGVKKQLTKTYIRTRFCSDF